MGRTGCAGLKTDCGRYPTRRLMPWVCPFSARRNEGHQLSLADEVQARLRLPVVGEIPTFSSPADAIAPLSQGFTMDPMLCTYFQPRSPQSEAIRSLRTTMMISRRSSASHLIQITSPSPGDGKSTLTANLAISLAQLGHRVLIIDADLHQPRQHEIFGVDSPFGIASVINSGMALAEVARPTAIDGLSLLPAGTPNPGVSELFSSKGFATLLQGVKSGYDYVLIDSNHCLPFLIPVSSLPKWMEFYWPYARRQ